MTDAPDYRNPAILENEWKRYKFVGRIITSSIIGLLSWEDFDFFTYQLFCRHFKTLPLKTYDDQNKDSYTIGFLPVLSHQEVVVRIVNVATKDDVLKFKRKYNKCIYKLFYVSRSWDDPIKKWGERNSFLIKEWPKIEIVQHHILAKAAVVYNLDTWLAEKIKLYNQPQQLRKRKKA